MKHATPLLQEIERLVRQGVLRQALMPEFYNLGMFAKIADLASMARSSNATDSEHARKIWHAWRHKYAAAIMPRLAKNYEITNHRDLVVLFREEVLATSEFDSMLRHAIERKDGAVLAGAQLFYPIPISWPGLWTLIHKLPNTASSRIKIREYVIRRFGQRTGQTSEERSESAMALSLALRVRQDLARLYSLARLWRSGDTVAAVYFEYELAALRAAGDAAVSRAAGVAAAVADNSDSAAADSDSAAADSDSAAADSDSAAADNSDSAAADRYYVAVADGPSTLAGS